VWNKQSVFLAIILISLLTGSALLFETDKSKMKQERVVFPELGLQFEVDVAETEKQRRVGLMYTSLLATNRGMLFIFEQEQIQKVWMKNTLIALDVVFISENDQVVSIIQGMTPCMKEPCEIYSSDSKARYMLELNAGIVKGKGIKVGKKVIFE